MWVCIFTGNKDLKDLKNGLRYGYRVLYQSLRTMNSKNNAILRGSLQTKYSIHIFFINSSQPIHDKN